MQVIDINKSVDIKCFQSKSLVIANHLSRITIFYRKSSRTLLPRIDSLHSLQTL